MKFCFRVDSSNIIGTGHVMRCLRLAHYIKRYGHDVFFISRNHLGNINSRVSSRDIRVIEITKNVNLDFSDQESNLTHSHWLGTSWEVDAKQTENVLVEHGSDWIIVDHYALDWRWERYIKRRFNACKIMVIDDLADRLHQCNILLDQNINPKALNRYTSLVPLDCTKLMGPQFALIDERYSQLHSAAINTKIEKIENILVYFGGADIGGLTIKVIEALSKSSFTSSGRKLSVILQKETPDYSNVQNICDDYSFALYNYIEDFPTFLSKFDFIIGAGGSTSWERLSLGIPGTIYALADNQKEVSLELEKLATSIFLGTVEEFNPDRLVESLNRIFEDKKRYQEMRSRCLGVCDGNGIRRVYAILMGDNYGSN